MAFRKEADLHQRVLKAIEDDKLSEAIFDSAGVATANSEEADDQFPQFSIDHLARKAALRAGRLVMESLTLLVLLTSDKNVSITQGETLRPDIVCINPELESIVIFELKKDFQTGRQSLTELLAYEQEVKNLLPFLSNYDVNLVLISSEWSPLMDHAVSAAVTWSGRKILCLEADEEGGKLQLRTRVPSAWKVTGSVYFPEDALPCVTVCLYEKDAYSEGWKKDVDGDSADLDPRIWTALEIIAREGDRLGGHGFALLWRDRLSISLTSYNITVCSVSPFPFYRLSRRRGILGPSDGRLVPKLDSFIKDHGPQGHSAALIATATAAYPLLREVANPALEGFNTWDAERLSLSRRAEPLLCEFWGTLGHYARAYVMNPAVRRHRRNTLVGGTGDWRHPSVGLPLIQSFTRPEIFFEGEVRCSDAFRLGVLVGLDRVLRFNLRRAGGSHSMVRCQFEWNRIELMAVIDEVRLLADGANNVMPPDDPLKFYDDPLADDEKDHQRFSAWLLQEFFRESPTHALFFEVGVRGALVFDESRQGFSGRQLPEEFAAPMEAPIRNATTLVLACYRQMEDERALGKNHETLYRQLRRALGVPKNFSVVRLSNVPLSTLVSAWPLCLDASDRVLNTVFHEHAPVAPANIDWPWLKQGVTEMRARGEIDAGVILLPNGQIVTGRVLPTEVVSSIKIDDPSQQVPFLDRSHGIGLMRVVTWAELESGTAFRPFKDLKASKPDVQQG
jgi:hypothetical protein